MVVLIPVVVLRGHERAPHMLMTPGRSKRNNDRRGALAQGYELAVRVGAGGQQVLENLVNCCKPL